MTTSLAERLGRALSEHWRVMLAVLPGLMLTALHSTMLDVPRATVVAALDSDRYRVQWIVGAYVVGSATGMALTRYVGTRLGLGRAYLLGLALFAGSATLCGLTSTVVEMAPLRLVQGLGNGLVISVGMVLLWRAFPQGKEYAMALYGMAVFLPALTGATVGGLLTTFDSWRLIFLINLPLGLVLGVVAWWVLPKDEPAQSAPLDWFGLFLLLGWIVTLSVVIDLGQYWGWLASPYFVPWFVGCLVFFVTLVGWGVWAETPLIGLRPLAVPHFALGVGIKVLFSINLYVLVGLLSGYAIELRGYQWWQGALVLLPGTITMLLSIVVGIVVGHLGNRRARMAIGLTAMAVATWLLGEVDVFTAREWAASCVALWGAGAGLVVGPALVTTFAGLSNEQTLRTAGVFNVLRSLPVFLVGGLLTTFLTQRTDAHFDYLRQTVRPNQPVVADAIRRSQSHFVRQGASTLHTTPQAHATLGRWAQANARAAAFRDVFRGLALIPAVGLLLVTLVNAAERIRREHGSSTHGPRARIHTDQIPDLLNPHLSDLWKS